MQGTPIDGRHLLNQLADPILDVVKCLGAMTDARLKTFFDVMSANKVFDPKLDYRKAFDTRFVNKGRGVAATPARKP